MMCIKCGAITHFGDIEKLRSILPEKGDSEEE